jgi:hypothetical protein
VTVRAFSQVFPMIDCEIVLEVDMHHVVGCLAEVTVTVDEVPGPSQLPPTKADTPAGAPTHRGIPILDIDPNWSEGVRRGRSRQGSEFTSGRARSVAPLADRSRERTELNFLGQRGCDGAVRQDFWRLVQFFDTRRGRLRSFWQIDQERIWECGSIATGSVQVVPLGEFDDFEEELQGGQIGLVLFDGITTSFYVRDVSATNDLGTAWEALITPALPAGLNAANAIRVARARLVRFDSDEMEETWTTAGVARSSLKVIETLDEQDVEL